ncbi:MAG: S-adenosyl-l-methionine hydroxide adenosyltransferase family protein [Thermoguttaceae bacterium]
MPIITLTTDLGAGSPYVAAMKGVIFSIDPATTIVDISHVVPFRDITRGAQVLEDATPWFPDGTIHLAIVDQGADAAQSILYARIGSQQYIAPDNRLLGRLMAGTRPSMVLRLTQQEHWLPEFSRKFVGRDIMAPVAVRLSLGLDPRQLGPVAAQLDQPGVKEEVHGEIMSIDSFGNLVTNILYDHLAGKPTDARACIACGVYETFGVHRTYGGHTPGTLVALIGSSGRLELAVVGDNAAERTGVSIGTPVVVAWNQNNGE